MYTKLVWCESMSVREAADRLLSDRQKTMTARNVAERKVAKTLSNVDDDLGPTSSVCCFPFFGRSKYADLKKLQANNKLAKAAEQLSTRVGDLAARVSSSRATAATLHAAGKKTEALAALRRSKALEKQLATSQSALESLESQLLLMEDAKLQSEISTALAASTGDIKKKTKGLLKKTEKAVDDAAEVKDLADDVRGAMEGLHPTDMDEDELMAELAEMEVPQDEPKAAPQAAEPKQVTPTITFSLPSVPQGKVLVREEGVAMSGF